ncbi:MAG: lipoprotein signal peptidase [Bacteroidetes bacterium]|nr:lipoprotein signal peptidase [Bacteroidota bacterium]MDA1120064.1 lipoprotein signal peptidase [Bacteroidota bacterium]
MRYFQYYLISFVVIGIDQAVKMLVHFNMEMGVAGQIHLIDDIFKLHYLTNPGMAFGMELGSDYGKLFLTLFRLVAMGGISYYLYLLIHKKIHRGLIFCVALILGGAVGNVIDSTFYGVLLDNAPYNAASPWFHGQVIDMFYIDIWEGRLPAWIPFWGGQYMALWPVFNIADSSIFIGVSIILIFQKHFFVEKVIDAPAETPVEINDPEPVSVGSEPENPS